MSPEFRYLAMNSGSAIYQPGGLSFQDVDADTHGVAGKSDNITRDFVSSTPDLSRAYDNDNNVSFPPEEQTRLNGKGVCGLQQIMQKRGIIL